MTNTDTRDVPATLRQIRRLTKVGCEIVRLGVPDIDAARSLGSIVKNARIPVIADIHFDHKLALEAMKQGVHGLRLNPGNIGGKNKVREVVREAENRNIPIRIGVNAGSLEKRLLEKFSGATPEAMVESALGHVRILEDEHFDKIKVSLKASDVLRTVRAYELLAAKTDYPLHVGITEAGTLTSGMIKSSVGIGILLWKGIGDTVRVSLTAPPHKEVEAAYDILRSLDLRRRGVELISCPTCSRTEIDLISLAAKVERSVKHIKKPLKVAVMGCVVNGPGEAREADIGLAGGRGCGIIFKKGKSIGTFSEQDLLPAFLREIEKIVEDEPN
jgi:(E)-4-hydroxy-3-methylbut-2-enyl-diphosphate synthase